MDPINFLDPALIATAPNLIGFILPPIVDVLNKDIPPDKTLNLKVLRWEFKFNERFIATLAICLATATMVKFNSLQTGSYDEILKSFGIIFTESQMVFKLYFSNSNLRTQIQDVFEKEEDPILATPGIAG